MSNLPADWARSRMIALCEEFDEKPSQAFARYIEAHEKPPIGRKLLCAREAAAEWNEQYAAATRRWPHDETCGRAVAGEKAIALHEEGYGKDPETVVPQCQ